MQNRDCPARPVPDSALAQAIDNEIRRLPLAAGDTVDGVRETLRGLLAYCKQLSERVAELEAAASKDAGR